MPQKPFTPRNFRFSRQALTGMGGASGVFFQRVYALVARIPAGGVMTYGQIAAYLGGACSARVVGYAMHSAPSGLPCHRVVNKAGEMAGGTLFGGAARQRQLLQSEGVAFRPDGRIDLDASRFHPEEGFPRDMP